MPAIPVTPPPQAPLPGKDSPPPATLHWVPASYPIYGAGLIIFAVVFILMMSAEIPELRGYLLRLATLRSQLYGFAATTAVALVVMAIASHYRRKQLPVMPPYLRYNHAIFQGLLFAFALVALRISQSPPFLEALFDETRTQLVSLLPFVGYSAVAYLGWIWPRPIETQTDHRAYQVVVQSLRNSYDLVVGLVRPDDWKNCVEGAEQWLILKTADLWTNVFAFGGVGAGKTSEIAYPLLAQLIMKYPDDDAMRPSVMLLDYKGDNIEHVYGFAAKSGRQGEYIAIRPGNKLLDANGKNVIPPSCFRTWNPVGGTEPAEIRATFLLDGLNAVDETSSKSSNSEYFERIEREFLVAAISMFDTVFGQGTVTLYQLYRFCYDESYRESIANHKNVTGTDAKRYFEKAIEVLDADQKTQLVSGLRAKLAPIATPVMQETFCPDASSKTIPFEGFVELLIDKPRVVVFCVDQGQFGKEIARLLGVMFMRYFQQAMLKRNSSSFKQEGHNMTRLVLQMTDEASAYMNPGVAEFTSVSRQSRTCSIFLTQSLGQVPDKYRDVIEGNFRTKILLGVNDKLTLERFEFLFGQVKESKTNVSTSQNLNEVKHGMFTQVVSGKSQGLSVSTSTSEEWKPRFSSSEILYMPGGKAVIQMYDGEMKQTIPATAMTTTPWYKLEYHLYHPLEHPAVRCRKAKGKIPHDYRPTSSGGLKCSVCSNELDAHEAHVLENYRQIAPF